MITPPHSELLFEYHGPVRGANRRLAWSPRAGRAFPDRAYSEFKHALAATIRLAMGTCPPWPFPLDGPLALFLDLFLPPRMDTDSLIKPVLDALELSGAITNDHQIEQLRVQRLGVTRSPWLIASLVSLHTLAGEA